MSAAVAPRGPAPQALDALVRPALEEDVGWADATTAALVDPTVHCRGRFVNRADGVIAGLPVVASVFRVLDANVACQFLVEDGQSVSAGTSLATVTGPAASVLTGERVALNYLQRLSGVATLTARYVAAVAGTGARIVDTRKTTPGLRVLEKYAVRCGGGSNHRFGLSDGVLIKDNHIALLLSQGYTLRDVVARARSAAPHSLRVEVEVDRFDQIEEALAGGADAILLDNMSPVQLAEAVHHIAGRAVVEASGGVSLASVRAVAESGVDIISVGALTHSAVALDIGLDFS